MTTDQLSFLVRRLRSHASIRSRTADVALRLCFLTWGAWHGLLYGSAHAGPVEQLSEVALSDGQPVQIILRYENGGGGLLFGGHESSRWQLQCGAGYLAPGERSRGPLLRLVDGSALVVTAAGVVVVSPRGCNARLELPADEDTEVYDLVADPSETNAAFALISIAGRPTSHTGLWHRSSDGTWTAYGKPDANALATSVRVAVRAGQLRIYEAALVPMQDEDAGARYFVYSLRYSDDGANSFQEFTLPVDSSPRIIGIDPQDPDRVAILVDRPSTNDAILVSHDAGAHFTPYLELAGYGGIAFAPDGRVWLASRDDAARRAGGTMWSATNLGSPPERLPDADYAVQCLGYHAASDTLYACQHFWFGEVDPTTGAFTTSVSFDTVDELVSCDEAAARCEQQLCQNYCGPAHFAVAPVCAVYDAPDCGLPVAMREGGTTAVANVSAATGARAQPTRSSSTETSRPAAELSDPTRERDAGAAKSHTPTAPPASSCSAVFRRRKPVSFGWLLWLLGLVLVGRVYVRITRRDFRLMRPWRWPRKEQAAARRSADPPNSAPTRC